MNLWQSPCFWSSNDVNSSLALRFWLFRIRLPLVVFAPCEFHSQDLCQILKFFSLQVNHPTFEEYNLQLLALTGVSQALREGYSWFFAAVRFQALLLQRKHMEECCQAEWLSVLKVDKTGRPPVVNLFSKNNCTPETPSLIKHSVYSKCVLSSQVPRSLPPDLQKFKTDNVLPSGLQHVALRRHSVVPPVCASSITTVIMFASIFNSSVSFWCYVMLWGGGNLSNHTWLCCPKCGG